MNKTCRHTDIIYIFVYRIHRDSARERERERTGGSAQNHAILNDNNLTFHVYNVYPPRNSGKLTYPTWGKESHLPKSVLGGDMLALRRASIV